MNNKLGIAEFEEVLLEKLSSITVNKEFFINNIDNWDSLLCKLYDDYLIEDNTITDKALYVFRDLFFEYNDEDDVNDLLNY
jgi:hypothetical protein